MTLFSDVQRKAKEEIDTVIGSKRLISYDDRLSLPYVEALCREVARWRPVFPLSLFHACSSDDVYKGFYIPKGQQIITNWAVCVHNIIYRSNSSEQHLVSLYLHSKARHVVLTVERSLTGQLLMIQRDILTQMRSTPTVSSMKMEIWIMMMWSIHSASGGGESISDSCHPTSTICLLQSLTFYSCRLCPGRYLASDTVRAACDYPFLSLFLLSLGLARHCHYTAKLRHSKEVGFTGQRDPS